MKRSSGVIDLGVKNAGIPPGELILACCIRKRQGLADLDAGLAVGRYVRASDVVLGLRAGPANVQDLFGIGDLLSDFKERGVGRIAKNSTLPDDLPDMRLSEDVGESLCENVAGDELH